MEQKMKVIFLAYSIGDSSVSHYFTALAKKLSEHNTVIIFSDKKRTLSYKNENTTVFYWPSTRPTKWADFSFLHSKMKTYQPVLTIATFGANTVFSVVGFYNKVQHRWGTHRSISTHFKTQWYKQIRKRISLQLNTKIIANSKATKADLMTTFGFPEDKIKVVYNAVKDPCLTNNYQPQNIVYVGRLTENKGVSILLKAFSLVVKKNPSITLTLAGGSQQDVDVYSAEATSLGISSHINFLGSQPKEVVLDLFSKANFALVPSFSEGFGFVVIEAFSVGTPVIGSNTGGIKEIIRDGKDGLLIPPKDTQALAQAIEYLYTNPKVRDAMAKEAKQHFLTTFELYSSTQATAQFIEQTLATGR